MDPEERNVAVAIPPIQPLWVPIATCLLQRLCPTTHPALALLSVAHSLPAEAVAGRPPAKLIGGGLRGPALPSGPLRHMAEGLQALGPPLDIGQGSLQPGSWSASAPLWGNPLLQLELRADQQQTIAWHAPSLPTPLPTATDPSTVFAAEQQVAIVRRHWATGWAYSPWSGHGCPASGGEAKVRPWQLPCMVLTSECSCLPRCMACLISGPRVTRWVRF